MKDIDIAYHKVFRDMMLHGPDMFKGVYDANNGDETFMFGIQTVIDYIAYKDGKDTYDRFTDMFTSNLIKSEEMARANERNENEFKRFC